MIVTNLLTSGQLPTSLSCWLTKATKTRFLPHGQAVQHGDRRRQYRYGNNTLCTVQDASAAARHSSDVT